MPYFNEKQLEESIIALLQEQGYEHVKGEAIERNLDEVVLRETLRPIYTADTRTTASPSRRWRAPSASSPSGRAARCMKRTATR